MGYNFGFECDVIGRSVWWQIDEKWQREFRISVERGKRFGVDDFEIIFKITESSNRDSFYTNRRLFEGSTTLLLSRKRSD